ncbi:MAG: glycosyl hydrolase family 31, partial [Phycisphaerales bacterium]|nr:glycosyl hydrolase family 31 [Phycisphaerales bacterium]
MVGRHRWNLAVLPATNSGGLNFCAAGLPYWTTDTGGFFRPGDQYTSKAYHELLVRWFEWSTFCPILRIHGWESRTEMWNYGKNTMALLRRFDVFRYRMLPYIYSVAWNVTHNGVSIMQPLMMVFPHDPKAAAVSHEYMFGPDFLVAPVLQPMVGGEGHTSVYLPAGVTWINFWTGKTVAGGQTLRAKSPLSQMPLFVRAGSLLPLGPKMQWATQ